MKKFVSLTLLCIIALTSVAFAEPELVAAGDLLSTDIKTYINGHRIKSYNVNGYTALIAEDLLKYGFKVDWDSNARLLAISKPDYSEFFGDEIDDNNKIEVGKKIGIAYYTDIRTVVDNIAVLSYNIGGKTAIFTDALRLFGDVSYNDDERAVYCEIEGLTYKKPVITITDNGTQTENNEEQDDESTVEVPIPEEEKDNQTVEVPIPEDIDEKKEETDEETVEVPVPKDEEAQEKNGYYSNAIVPDYTTVTGVELKEMVEKANNYVSYTYDIQDNSLPDKYLTYIVDEENFEFSKANKGKNDTLIYYYVKNNIALAVEIDNTNNILTITCKK